MIAQYEHYRQTPEEIQLNDSSIHQTGCDLGTAPVPAPALDQNQIERPHGFARALDIPSDNEPPPLAASFRRLPVSLQAASPTMSACSASSFWRSFHGELAKQRGSHAAHFRRPGICRRHLDEWVPSAAQDTWPSKPITVIVPFGAGGNTDALARIYSAQLSARLGQQFVIENRVGAGSITGLTNLAKAAPTLTHSCSTKYHANTPLVKALALICNAITSKENRLVGANLVFALCETPKHLRITNRANTRFAPTLTVS